MPGDAVGFDVLHPGPSRSADSLPLCLRGIDECIDIAVDKISAWFVLFLDPIKAVAYRVALKGGCIVEEQEIRLVARKPLGFFDPRGL